MDQFLKPLHLACGDDDLRPNIRLIEIKNNIASATEGHILVKLDLTQTSMLQPEQLKTLDGKYIDKEVWKEIYKCDLLEFDDAHIICHKNSIKKMFEYATPNGEFFNINKIIEQAADDGVEAKTLISYNSKFINILQKIFQNESLTFSFSKGNQGTFVYPYEHSGMFAILMPQASENTNRYYFM